MIEHRKKFLINVFYAVTVGLIFYFIIRFCFNFIMPVVVGVLPALLVQKPAKYISKRVKTKQEKVCVLLVVLFYVLLIFVLYMLFFSVYNNFDSIQQRLLSYVKNFSKIANNLQENLKERGFSFSINTVIEPFVSRTTSYVSGILGQIISNIPSAVINIIVMLVTSIYIGKDFNKIKKFLKEALPKNYLSSLNLIKKIAVNDCFKMIKGYSIMAFIAFCIMFAYFLIFGFKNAFLKALLIAVIDALPVFGVGIVLIPYSIICFINKNMQKAILLVVLYVLITVTRNALQPKIIGKQTGIHPMVTLVSLLLGLKFFGAKGLILMPYIVVVTIHYLKEKFIISRGCA